MTGRAAGLAAVRRRLSGLTPRGRSFLTAAAAAGGCGVVLGQQDLIRVGVLLALLPLGCLATLSRIRPQLSLTRTVTPGRVPVGGTAQVRLELAGAPRRGTRLLLAEDRLPPGLGASPRFSLAAPGPGQRALVSYPVEPAHRGRHLIGPLTVHLGDLFGLCEVTCPVEGGLPLLALPRTWSLTPPTAGGGWGGRGELVSRRAAASGEDDATTREYRQGDPQRRVHWRSTARRGELMVRRDEQPQRPVAAVLLDCRAVAHGGEGPESSFETAVSAAGSIGRTLIEQQVAVRLLGDGPLAGPGPGAGGGTASPVGGPGADPAGQLTALLDRLATVELGEPELFTRALAAGRGGIGTGGLTVAVLGALTAEDLPPLAAIAPGGRRIALLLRTEEWQPGLGAVAERAIGAERGRHAALLRSAGWTVVDLGRGHDLRRVWATALSGPTALTERGQR